MLIPLKNLLDFNYHLLLQLKIYPLIPNLGINLRRHLFQQIGAETFVQIEEDVIEQIATWLPFLQVLDVTTSEDIENNLIRIGVKYSFKSSPQLQDSVQVQMNTGASY